MNKYKSKPKINHMEIKVKGNKSLYFLSKLKKSTPSAQEKNFSKRLIYPKLKEFKSKISSNLELKLTLKSSI